MENKKCVGFVLKREYPGSKQKGVFEPFTTGNFFNYPEVWSPVYVKNSDELSLFSEKEKNADISELTEMGKIRLEIIKCILTSKHIEPSLIIQHNLGIK